MGPAKGSVGPFFFSPSPRFHFHSFFPLLGGLLAASQSSAVVDLPIGIYLPDSDADDPRPSRLGLERSRNVAPRFDHSDRGSCCGSSERGVGSRT